MILTLHARRRMAEGNVAESWVALTVTAPERTEPDRLRPGITRSWRRIPEFGGRALRVAHRPEGDDFVVVTTHWDRDVRL